MIGIGYAAPATAAENQVALAVLEIKRAAETRSRNERDKALMEARKHCEKAIANIEMALRG